MRKIGLIGSTGMLGHAVAGQNFAGYELVEINRQSSSVNEKNNHVRIGSNLAPLEESINLKEFDFVINCAGLIRQKIDETTNESKQAACEANIEIPLKLLSLSEKYDFKIIQIGTDCVFSGRKGNYVETDKHDAIDIYGRTKSLGEIPHPNFSVIRTSIVGKERGSSKSLLSWVLSQPKGASIFGYTDQIWNGVTVIHFAKFVVGIIEKQQFQKFAGIHHVVPQGKVTKDLLLRKITSAFHRDDIKINSIPSGHKLDMTLATNDHEKNQILWNLAGYDHPLSIDEMILEYSLSVQHGG